MSKVIFKSPYAKNGNSVGVKYANYIAKRERVDKTINAKRVEINLNYIATRPCVEKLGEHGLFGQEDNINLKKASHDILHHTGVVWMPIVSLKREDADRLGYNNAETWRNLLRSKQFEIADAYKIPVKDLVWYAAFHDEGDHPHIHMIIYNKNPGSEYLSRKSCNDLRNMFTKVIFKDELKQLYDERQSFRDKIVEVVKDKLDDFEIRIDGVNDEFADKFMELKTVLNGYTGRKNYQFISREQKDKVNEVVKLICKDENIQNLYQQWCQIQLALLKYYHNEPEKCFDALENNLSFQKRIQNAVLKAAIKDNKQENVYTNKVDATPVYADIVFNLCKMFEQSIQHDIKEGFTKSIVDSKDRIKEAKRNHSLGIHTGGM